MSRFQWIRAMIVIAGAALVLPGVAAVLLVILGRAVANGLPIEMEDLGGLVAFGGGGLVVVGITGRAMWRERASTRWAAYGTLVALLVVVGACVGARVGWSLSGEHIAREQQEAAHTCNVFLLSHPSTERECEQRALACRAQVREHPPVGQRGLGGAPPIDRGAPTEPRARAIWECMGGH